jgi:hypothetical protein
VQQQPEPEAFDHDHHAPRHDQLVFHDVDEQRLDDEFDGCRCGGV